MVDHVWEDGSAPDARLRCSGPSLPGCPRTPTAYLRPYSSALATSVDARCWRPAIRVLPRTLPTRYLCRPPLLVVLCAPTRRHRRNRGRHAGRPRRRSGRVRNAALTEPKMFALGGTFAWTRMVYLPSSLHTLPYLAMTTPTHRSSAAGGLMAVLLLSATAGLGRRAIWDGPTSTRITARPPRSRTTAHWPSRAPTASRSPAATSPDRGVSISTSATDLRAPVASS